MQYNRACSKYWPSYIRRGPVKYAYELHLTISVREKFVTAIIEKRRKNFPSWYVARTSKFSWKLCYVSGYKFEVQILEKPMTTNKSCHLVNSEGKTCHRMGEQKCQTTSRIAWKTKQRYTFVTALDSIKLNAFLVIVKSIICQ